VRGELDLLVPPLGRAVVAGDQPGAVQAAQVAVDERVPGLRLVRRALGQPEVPLGVLLPRMPLEEGVLVGGAGCTSPQSLSSTYWRDSISCSALAMARRLTVYVATSYRSGASSADL
jgi:hypothetical protein